MKEKMNNKIKPDWKYGSWEGSRILQLKISLKLTARQRFEALEEIAETSTWLTGHRKKSIQKFRDS